MRPTAWLGNRCSPVALSAGAPAAGSPTASPATGPCRPTPRPAAEIIHDYNYAQVLTLDLLGKGFRYAEVPISYRFRTRGRSFVRLVPYLRRVVPAVVRQVRGTPIGLG